MRHSNSQKLYLSRIFSQGTNKDVLQQHMSANQIRRDDAGNKSYRQDKAKGLGERSLRMAPEQGLTEQRVKFGADHKDLQEEFLRGGV